MLVMRRLTLAAFAAMACAAVIAVSAPLRAQQPPSSAPPATAGQPTPQPAAPAAQPAPVAPPAAPEAVLPPEMLEPITRISRSIETAEKSIQQLKELEGELSRLRTDVERIIYDSTATAEGLRPQLAEVRSQIEKLGPPPKAGEPPESPTVLSERNRLNAMAGALDGAIKTTELAWVRAKQLIDRITVIRYQQFARNLFERRDSPLLPGVWRDVNSRMENLLGRAKYYGRYWLEWASQKTRPLTALVILAIVVSLGVSLLVGRTLRRKLARPDKPPSFFERAMLGAWIAPARMIGPAAGVLILYFGLDELDLLFPPWNGLASVLLKGLLTYIAASALLTTALAPRYPAWRLIPVADGTALRMAVCFKAFVAVYVLDTVLLEINRTIYAPLTVTAAQSFIISIINAGLLVYLLLSRFEPLVGPDRPVNGHEYVPGVVTRHTPLWVKLPVWLIAVTIIVASVTGFIALGRFVAHQVVLTGLVAGVAGVGYLAIRAMTRGRTGAESIVGTGLARFGLEDTRRRQISRLIEVMATFGLLLLTLPVLLVQWGFSGDDIRDWSKALLFGFEVGQFRISLVRILIGILLFTGLLFATRLFQRWLRDQVLTQPRVDVGIANSVDTAVGYAGTGLALLLAVSYAGFDVTSLAIFASALAVGVGFGLQSIVNNFVSGLILLVERPIKVGDWIVVGGEQGNVRRISVRSTEIETFDRASLIVPNAELISGRVLNWTHRNSLGRTMLKITLDADVDPERVINILQSCAEAHPDVLKTPKPSVTFDNFSSTALEFTIRVTLADVYRGGGVATELRIAILRILKEQGLIKIATSPDAA